MQKWDYSFQKVNIETEEVVGRRRLPDVLKSMGDDGWELVSLAQGASGYQNAMMIFKRPKP